MTTQRRAVATSKLRKSVSATREEVEEEVEEELEEEVEEEVELV